MPDQYSQWFSDRLGYEVHLAYLGVDNYRPVLGNLAPNASTRNPAWKAAQAARAQAQAQTSWLQKLANGLPGMSTVTADPAETVEPGYEIGFADCSPYMIVNARSFEDVAARFPSEDPLEIEKFRPNIVVAGAEEAFEEDFWGELCIHGRDDVRLQLTSNCVRCTSLNVDWATGKFGTSAKGNVLKTLAKDRRVDRGHKYSPVFGRYGFLVRGADKEGLRVGVGDEVEVTKSNEERTVFRWPGIGQTKKEDLYPVEDVEGVGAA